MKEPTIKVRMNERWIPHFMSMLKYMEYCGKIGSSKEVGFYSDGDGDFNPEFDTDIEWEIKEPVRGKENVLYDAG